MDARRKYRISNLSSLPWVPDPKPPYQARYYLKWDVILRALQENNGPQGLKKAREVRHKRAVDRLKNKEC
jgi:hypothetical protein